MKKTCPECSKEFSRRPKESAMRFATKTYCSLECNTKRHKRWSMKYEPYKKVN